MTHYTATEVVRMTGVSYRRLDYWDRLGYLVPSVREAQGSGSVRLYSDEDVAKAALIERLQRLGIDLHIICTRGPETVVNDLVDLLVELGVLHPSRVQGEVTV